MSENSSRSRQAATRARRFAAFAGVAAVLAATVLTGSAWAASPSSPASVRIDGAAAGERVGASVAPAGDVNGDGRRDVILGAPGALPNANGTSAGGAYVLLGPFQPGATVDLANLQGRGFALRGSAGSGELAGQSVAAAGDVNADGLADVIVGAPGATPSQEGPQTQVGKAYIVFGSRTPHDLGLAALGAGGITLTGQAHHFPDAFGWQVAGVGDIDRDGHADVAIAAPGNPGFEDEYTKGRAYVVFGRRTPGAISMTGLGRRGFKIGFDELISVAGAGDWNRDGHTDVALLGGKQAYVVYGHRYRTLIDLSHLGRHGLTIRQKTRLQFDTGTLAGGLDFSGDGRPDLVIGEPMSHYFGLGPANGGVVLVRGSAWRRTLDLAAPGSPRVGARDRRARLDGRLLGRHRPRQRRPARRHRHGRQRIARRALRHPRPRHAALERHPTRPRLADRRHDRARATRVTRGPRRLRQHRGRRRPRR